MANDRDGFLPELLNCPFCGGGARLISGYGNEGTTICCLNDVNEDNRCPVDVGVFEPAPWIPHEPDNPQTNYWLDFDTSNQRAVERWNTRTPPAAAEGGDELTLAQIEATQDAIENEIDAFRNTTSEQLP